MSEFKNKKTSFGYEDTDKSIEINLYGLDFEINNIDNIDKLKDIDKDDENIIEAQIEEILGKGSIEKINNKRVSDGYKKLDLNIELNILGCIFEAYATASTNNVLGRVVNAVDNINKDIDDNLNREQRRNYNRNKYRGNRRNYRRY